MDKKYKVAVLMSTYNGEKYIKDQVNSILNQQGNIHIDLFVRDDGSTDRTIDILSEYSNIRVFTGENLKPAKSFIELFYLIDINGYDYFAFSDQDDVWFKEKITKQIESIEDMNKPAISLCNSYVVDESLTVDSNNVTYKKRPILDAYSISCAPGIQGCATLFNSELASTLRSHKKPSIVLMHDSYIARVCTACGGVIEFLNTPLFLYRQHGNNVEGVTQGQFNKIKHYFSNLFIHENPGIQEQSKEIVNIYCDVMEEDIREWYYFLSKYRNKIISKFKLAGSQKISYQSLKWSVFLRTKFLLGNK